MSNTVGKSWRGMGLVPVVLLAGCAHGPPRVECERHLVPINAPETLAQKPVVTSGKPARPGGKVP